MGGGWDVFGQVLSLTQVYQQDTFILALYEEQWGKGEGVVKGRCVLPCVLTLAWPRA